MSESDCVQVAVRIRPLVKSEYDRGNQKIIDKIPNEPQIVINNGCKNNDMFTYNHVFTIDDPQELIYRKSVYKMIDKLFEGYNVTILAYGQTGSGKTHTMGTTFDGNFNQDMGVIPRAMDDIFKKINTLDGDKKCNVKCSFMELYQEQLYDLLSTKSRDQSIVDIREDQVKGIIIPGLTEIDVTTVGETINCLMKGSGGRATGATAMNAQSSRSHAIFTVTLEMFITP